MQHWQLALAAMIGVSAGASVPPLVAAAQAQGDPFDTARHHVVNRQNDAALQLIDSGRFPIDQTNDEGWTLLHYAAEAGNLDLVTALLQRGADPTLKTKWGSTPYDVASATAIRSIIAAAVKARTGRDPSARGSSLAAPPVSRALAARTTPPPPASPRQKQCQARWYASQALCSDSSCKMREYRKWQTCLKTGSYY